VCQPTVLTSRAAKLRPVLCLLCSASCTRYHADSFRRGVTRVLSVNAAAGSLECATRFKLLSCQPALGSASVFVALSSDRIRHRF